MVTKNSLAALVGKPKAGKPALSKSPRTWGASGVVHGVQLDQWDTAKIKRACKCHGVPRAESFKTGLGDAWCLYKACRRMGIPSSPRVVKRNLGHALDTIAPKSASAHSERTSFLNALDMNSRMLISAGDHTRWQALQEHVTVIVEALSRAETLARSLYPTRGALPNYGKTKFAAEVAALFKANGTRPTSTKTGVFVRVLCAMLDLESSSGHRLAMQGLQLWKTGVPGLIVHHE